MKNFLNKLKNNWITVFVNLIVLSLFIVFVSYIYGTFWNNNFYEQNLKQIEYSIDNVKLTSKDTAIINNKNQLMFLASEIKRVESNNDKRFEILGWTLGILSSFITIILGLSLYNSASKMKDEIKEQIVKHNDDIISNYDDVILKLTKISKEYSKELDDIQKKK